MTCFCMHLSFLVLRPVIIIVTFHLSSILSPSTLLIYFCESIWYELSGIGLGNRWPLFHFIIIF